MILAAMSSSTSDKVEVEFSNWSLKLKFGGGGDRQNIKMHK